jgi:hypothetical protein
MVKLHGKYAKGEERSGELLSCLVSPLSNCNLVLEGVGPDAEEVGLDVEGHGTDEEGDHREWETGRKRR